MLYNEFLPAIENRLEGAELFLHEMGQDLVPPHVNNPLAAAARLTGVVVDHPWERKFYHHVDAFLAMARRVPEIVQCCLGFDQAPAMRTWIGGLSPAEAQRRQAFQLQFKPFFDSFQRLPLSEVRNVT